MKKIPFEQVSLQVEILWKKEFLPNDIIGINEHCDFIRSFIESCGWSIDDYIRVMFGFNHLQKVN